MQSVDLPVQITVSGLLRAIAQLPPNDLDRFMAEAKMLQKRQRNEASLLDAIYKRLPDHQLQRLRLLETKLESETLTEQERTELLQLIELAETADVKRAEALLALAHTRQTTVPDLLSELHLETGVD